MILLERLTIGTINRISIIIIIFQWKKLSEEQKKHYEMRAEVVAVEKAKQDAIKASQAMTLLPGQVRIYQCKWAACDSQYDTESALLEHVIQHHTSQIISKFKILEQFSYFYS